MKALLISRPGDFDVLEDHWSDDPVFLPLPGGTVLDLHEASLRALGVTEARLLRCHPAGSTPDRPSTGGASLPPGRAALSIHRSRLGDPCHFLSSQCSATSALPTQTNPPAVRHAQALREVGFHL